MRQATAFFARTSAALFAALALALCLTASSAAAQSNDSAEAQADRATKDTNLKPLDDVLLRGKELYDQGKLSPDATLDMTFTAALEDDGRLDPDTVKVQGSASEESLTHLVKDFVAAVGESRLLAVLEGAKEVSMALKLDSQTLSIRVAGAVASEARAAQRATGYDLLVGTVRKKKEGTEEGALWNGIKVSADGPRLVIVVELPREVAARMIRDKLAMMAAAAAGRQ